MIVIESYKKDYDAFLICDTNSGNRGYETSARIVHALLSGVQISNAELISNGFRVSIYPYSELIYAKKLTKEDKIALENYLRMRREQKKNIKKEVEERKKLRNAQINISNIQDKINNEMKIKRKARDVSKIPDGMLYDHELCRKYNVSKEEFERLKNIGYTNDEIFGKKEKRDINQVIEDKKRVMRQLDSMERMRGIN